ncbi:hypothetical protein CEP52_016233 [Fusarium oligoseptatum]|uniref:Uncharacterized protein n=1 Tax=Fusarium oligoseptatum TaxID=2604345 RepID=A0A428S5N7_9HYPO|nr:hypothetical protein CEP52_016233 [Fusarium oligoseptatum]
MMKLDLGSRLSPTTCSKPCSKTSTGRKKHKPPCLATYASQEKKSREAKRLEANLRDPIAQYHAACRPLAFSSFDKPPPPGLDDATSLSTRPRV